MDALTGLNVLGLALSAVLLAMACVKADRVRGWRASIDPSAPEIPDAAFVVARVVLVTLAGLGVYTAVQGFGVSDDSSWNDSELTNAVHRATDELDGYRFQTDESGSPLHFDDYASLIEDKVVRNAGGDAPETGVAVTPAAGATAAGGSFTVTADGAGDAFCTRVERTRSKKDDYTPPGITGGEGTLTYLGYRLAVTVREGTC
ncbi:hypothetical protein SAMN05216532_5981 [Streptomyces sp. 2231.1]|uniref:hypothetical protein n=1 Tax=Streptomyces sp. 2231.1 TaxID=1855347 RepID=UPI0008965167|nr:hypothetical protein [Streptomyces sp. 2231.1]SED85524.1 hypothetical protein SAMN05216532_5981 [Streptomyces sp. 2231.1]